MTHGLFTTWEEDPLGVLLDTGMMRFETAFGIHGLAKVTDGRLDLLACEATRPGTGQFRRFIASCQRTFAEVFAMHDMNPLVGEALQRYGFIPCERVEPDGEIVRGWLFRRDATPAMSNP